jgi:hypothetical protein
MLLRYAGRACSNHCAVIRCLFNDVVSKSEYIVSDDKTKANNKL